MKPAKTLRLRANQIRIDGGTQMRAALDQEVIADYAEHLFDLPPIIVYFDGVAYWLADGFHRFHAHRSAGGDDALIDCIILTGTLREAILHAIGANKDHGLRRTLADRRKAVQAMLLDPEWSLWSVNRIADQAGVSRALVDSLKGSVTCVSASDNPQDSSESNLSQDSNTSKDTNSDLEFPDELPADEQPAPPDDGSQPEAPDDVQTSSLAAAKKTVRKIKSAGGKAVLTKTKHGGVAAMDTTSIGKKNGKPILADEPFAACNTKLDAAISKMLGAHADIREALDFEGGTFRSQWAKARDMDPRHTLEHLNAAIMHLRKERPAKIDTNDSKGYKTVREIELLSHSEKAVAAGSAK